MSTEENKALVRRFVDEVWNQGNLTVLEELLSAATLSPTADQHTESVAHHKDSILLYRAAFPDLAVTIERIVAEDDAVMVRWTGRGTHLGSLEGIATVDAVRSHGMGLGAGQLRRAVQIFPTGRQLAFAGVAEFGITAGTLTRLWVLLDELDVLTQLGALPVANLVGEGAPPTPAPPKPAPGRVTTERHGGHRS